MPDVGLTTGDGGVAGEPIAMPAALRLPIPVPPARRPRSIRRTSHIDMRPGPDGLTLDGAARDLLTPATGDAEDVAHATVRAEIDAVGAIVDLRLQPALVDATALVGIPAQSGFRAAVRDCVPSEVDASTPLATLLDDIPVATLISGYARLYQGALPADTARSATKSDICSGWRADGTMMRSVRSGTGVPVPVGPDVPDPLDERHDDPMGWHAMPTLVRGEMRRRRLVDVWHDGGGIEVRAMFRDTHVDPEGRESVLHEYDLTGRIDDPAGAGHAVISRCDAVPRVLPWVECPVAAASADRLVGVELRDVRDVVRRELSGVRTCTHLNDLLRSLADVGSLAADLARRTAGPGA